jgi:hypothetical protein
MAPVPVPGTAVVQDVEGVIGGGTTPDELEQLVDGVIGTTPEDVVGYPVGVIGGGTTPGELVG